MKNTRPTHYSRGVIWLVALSLAAGVWAGCGDDKPSNNKVVNNSDSITDTSGGERDTGQDVKDEEDGEEGDAPDASKGACDGVVCLPNEACVEGVCEDVGDIGFRCEAPRDLGVLAVGTPLQVDGNSDGQPVLLKTGCAAQDHSSQSVFKFQVAENAAVDIKFLETTLPVVMEVREDGCVDGSTALLCGMQSETFQAKAGIDYYLVVEARHDYSTGDFSVELSPKAAQVCSPAGSWSCDGTQRVQCFAGTEERVFECGSSCGDGVCAGDVCDNAVVVSDAVTVAGDTRAFENQFDLKDQPTCSTDRVTGPMTPGQDMVFSLPGLKAGQTISVDTTQQPGRTVIGVTRNCGISAGCVAADDQTGKLVWPVDVAGDYFVIIDRSSNANVPFAYQIEILD